MEHILEHVKKKRQVTDRSRAVNLFNAAKELGRCPKESRATDDDGKKERKVARNTRYARKKQLFTPEEESELDLLQAEADALVVKKHEAPRVKQAVNLINAVKKLGFYPKERRAKDVDGQNECKLAHNIRMAHKKKLFTPAQLTELEELKQNLVHPRHRATSAKPVAEAQGRYPKESRANHQRLSEMLSCLSTTAIDGREL